MKNNYLCLIGLVFVVTSMAQVGVNTTSPKAMLEVKSTDSANPNPTDGLLIPRVSNLSSVNPTADQDGMLIYLTNNVTVNANTYSKGFLYWDNTNSDWFSVGSSEWKSGTNNNGDALIYATQPNASGTKIVITDDGRIGIGTDNPVERFEFSGDDDNDLQITSANVNPPNVILYNTGGSLSVPSLANSNQEIGALLFKTNNGYGVQEVGGIHYFIDGTPSATSLPTKLVINNTKENQISDSGSFTIRANGNVGVGTLNPTAKLNLPAANGTANSAPLKFTAGTNLTVPESGAMEYDGNNLYFTNNENVREVVMKGVIVDENLDFPSIPNLSSYELDVPFNGITQGSICSCSPVGSIENGLTWSCYISDNNVVKVRLLNASIAGNIDPVSRNWKITVLNPD